MAKDKVNASYNSIENRVISRQSFPSLAVASNSADYSPAPPRGQKRLKPGSEMDYAEDLVDNVEGESAQRL